MEISTSERSTEARPPLRFYTDGKATDTLKSILDTQGMRVMVQHGAVSGVQVSTELSLNGWTATLRLPFDTREIERRAEEEDVAPAERRQEVLRGIQKALQVAGLSVGQSEVDRGRYIFRGVQPQEVGPPESDAEEMMRLIFGMGAPERAGYDRARVGFQGKSTILEAIGAIPAINDFDPEGVAEVLEKRLDPVIDWSDPRRPVHVGREGSVVIYVLGCPSETADREDLFQAARAAGTDAGADEVMEEFRKLSFRGQVHSPPDRPEAVRLWWD